MYCKKAKIKISKYSKKRSKKRSVLKSILTISICKFFIILIFYIFLRDYKTKPIKKITQAYFLSAEHFLDSYKMQHSQINKLNCIYAMTKLRLKNYESFFKLLLLLSGDIALNPGPTYPCSSCDKSVRVGVFCKTCNMWIHRNCEGLTNCDLKNLQKIPFEELDFVCKICKAAQEALPFHNESTIPEVDQSFQFEDHHLNDMTSQDHLNFFKKKGLHFVHLNCNSLLSKIDEIRNFVLETCPHVICFSETKLDPTINDEEVIIDGYTILRHDRTRHGGGVACFINNSLNYNQRGDFSNDVENIFIDILLPKTKPILFGVVYRPPSDFTFLEKLSDSIMNSDSFENQEVYILGDVNINLIDKKNKFILKKGYRFSQEEANYSSPLHLTKKYKEFLCTHGLTQIIEEPTRITDKTSSLLDHILVNTPEKVTQQAVISKAISDHDIIFCTRKHTNLKTGKHNTIRIRSLKNYTKELFIEKLQETQFPNYRNFECVNSAYKHFIETVMEVIDKLAPSK